MLGERLDGLGISGEGGGGVLAQRGCGLGVLGTLSFDLGQSIYSRVVNIPTFHHVIFIAPLTAKLMLKMGVVTN